MATCEKFCGGPAFLTGESGIPQKQDRDEFGCRKGKEFAKMGTPLQGNTASGWAFGCVSGDPSHGGGKKQKW